MTDAQGGQQVKRPLRLVLSVLMVIEVFFVVRLSAEGVSENILQIVNSVGILVFCVLSWRGVPWGRWLVAGFLIWRLVHMGVSVVSHFAPGDHRIVGTLILAGIYVAAGVIIASPLGRSGMRTAN